MISLYVESKYYSRVDLKAFPKLKNRVVSYLEYINITNLSSG